MAIRLRRIRDSLLFVLLVAVPMLLLLHYCCFFFFVGRESSAALSLGNACARARELMARAREWGPLYRLERQASPSAATVDAWGKRPRAVNISGPVERETKLVDFRTSMRVYEPRKMDQEFRHLDYAALDELYGDLGVFPMQQEEIPLPPWMETDTPPDTPDAQDAQEEENLPAPLMDVTPPLSPSPVISPDEESDEESGIWLYSLITRRHVYIRNPEVRDCPAALLPDSPMSPEAPDVVEIVDLVVSPPPELEIVAVISPEVKILCEMKRDPREEKEDSDDDDDGDYSPAARPCETRKRPRPDDDDDDDEDFFAPCHCFNCLPPRRRLF